MPATAPALRRRAGLPPGPAAPTAARMAVAAALALAIWVAWVVEPQPQRLATPAWLVLDLVVGLGAVLLLPWRRLRPLPVALTICALCVMSIAAMGPATVAALSVFARRRWRDTAVVAVAYAAGTTAFSAIHDVPDLLVDAAINVVGTVVLVALGWAVGVRRAAAAGADVGDGRLARWLTSFTAREAWGLAWRMLVSAAFGLLVFFTMAGEGDSRGFTAGHLWLALDPIVGATGLLLLAFRRRWPLPITIATALLTAVSATAVGPSSLVAISLATRRRWREIAVAAVVLFASGATFNWVHRSPDNTLVSDLVVNAITIAFLVALGLFIGARRELVANLRERAETAEREQELRVAQARTNERARIAREMHDVLAHRISLVAMHAGALAYREDLPPEQVRTTAGLLQTASHQALTELREVLGVLRDTDSPAPGAPEPPQPTLRDLDDLVAGARAGGQQIEVSTTGTDLTGLPELVSRNAFRIVQEGLTNARKHAPGAVVRLGLAGRPGTELTITLRNERGGDGPAAPGSGLGLVGLRERATLSGGTLSAGPDRSGAFVVRAVLPWPPPAKENA
ncbi:sensor histidine kinase [Barrientosiimonas humi]|nr:histidine kinase [Barrientosiimonas humi]